MNEFFHNQILYFSANIK